MVRKHFSSLKNPPQERKRESADVPPYKTAEAAVVTDKEATSYNIGIFYPAYKSDPSSSIGDYREDLIEQMYTSILNQRLQELTQKENPPFIFASSNFQTFARGYQAFNVFA